MNYRINSIDWEVFESYGTLDVKMTENLYPRVMNACYGTTITKPTIKRVIFNNPATIIFWKDGTKTIVKCQDGDVYDEEKGFVMAYLKKLLGNDNTFNKEIKKYCIEQHLPDYLKG